MSILPHQGLKKAKTGVLHHCKHDQDKNPKTRVLDRGGGGV